MNRSGVQSGARARRDGESGYALLLVFLMAAILAISLYSELPRVAFQSQRHQEQLLMERGMQYMRAIQVYQQVNKGWPRSVDDIETFQTRHFLRHKYIDPMTGKDEWRLIHTSGVALTDSLITQNPATTQQSTSSQSNYVSAYAGIGETLTGDQSQRQAGPARRPSEGGGGDLPPMMGGSDQSGQLPLPGSTSDNPSNSAANTPNQGATGAQSGVPGMPGMAGSMPPGQTTVGIGGQMPGQGAPGQNAPGMPGLPGGTGNPALSMINNILTNPNPQAAQMAAQGGAFGSGTPATLGGGLAGVASKSAYEGIMVYNTQTLYKKWEFVFDPTKVAPIGGVNGTPGTPVNQMGSQTAQQGLASAFGGGLNGNQQAGGASAPSGIGMPGGTGTSSGTSMSSAFGASTSMSPGAQGNTVAGGNPNSPAGMQTGGAGSGALPPGFRMGRP